MARPKLNPDTVEKICPTCGKSFSVSFYKRNKQKFCGKSCANHHPDTISKMLSNQQKTRNVKYGGKHPMQLAEAKANFKKTMTEKYGVEHALQSPELMGRVRETKQHRYGSSNYNNIEKMKITCLKKYGVDNARKSDTVNKQVANTIRDSHFDYLLKFCAEQKVTLLSQRKDYVGYAYQNKYLFKCNVCDHEFETDVYKPHHIFCRLCNPTDHHTLENEIYKFIVSIVPNNVVVKQNDRTILNGKELDVYIPFKKIAYEINGLYWHSESASGIGKMYHLKKYKSCIFNKIRLIHIFENEWIFKKDIVKSIIRSSLGCVPDKIHARECVIKEVGESDKRDFLDRNHIQGNDQSKIKYGLYYNEELVSLMTFGVSRFDKKVAWEIVRYCNKLNTSVVGGASKLFSYFVENHKPDSIVSYSDTRYFDGNIYGILGFSFIQQTSPNYYYISNDYKSLYNRMSFQKHKLKKVLTSFDPLLTEWENMQKAGFDRIWDCGNSKWIWRPDTKLEEM